MSALYGLVLIGTWLGLTAWFWKTWRRWRVRPDANRRTVDAAGILFLLLWLGVSFWYGGGRMYYYDMQVSSLCAKDGGVKVYETVKLPPERFDQWGNIGVPIRINARPTDEYYFEIGEKILRAGDPTLVRSVTRIIRRSDGKVLGESIRYGRGGGDLPGPWHPSTFDCPSIRELNLESAIFLQGVDK